MGIPSDNPIESARDDVLGRYHGAKSFADQVLSFRYDVGLVVGVLGPWGSGKTSFLNLAVGEFRERNITVLAFNPWMFSGAEQLVSSFFIELAAELKLKPGLSSIADDLEDYGEAFSGLGWLPLVGTWIERARGANKFVTRMLRRRKEGVGERKKKLYSALADLSEPILVVIDDIDRLSTDEIRDIFKLVRLTASFPNVIYVLAFDRHRVEEALGTQGISGRDYLEKILQVAVDLPTAPSELLDRQVVEAVNALFEGVDADWPLNLDSWPDVYMEVIKPLVRNMRDVRRYTAAVHGTIRELAGQIEQVDVLGLEAIRVFLPDVFHKLHSSINGLTSTAVVYAGSEDPGQKAQIERLIAVRGAEQDVVRSMVHRLFPAGSRHLGGMSYGEEWKGRWLRERRVAHEDNLRLYLERFANESLLAFYDSETAWPLMADKNAFNGFLRSRGVERCADVISGLDAYGEQFEAQHVEPSIVVLLNLLPDLPERDRGLFSFEPRVVVKRLIYRLLSALPDEAAIETTVGQILPQVGTLSSKLELVDLIGYREGRGQKLISEAGAASFERSWRDEVRAAHIEHLAVERDLCRVVITVRRESESDELPLVLPESPEVTLAVLRSARSIVRSGSANSRSVRQSERLHWDLIVKVVGSEDMLSKRVAQLRAHDPTGETELLKLYDRYAAGWRPDEFHHDEEA